MKYSEEQVLDILKLATETPEQILEQWEQLQDNIPLDLSKYKYPLYVFTFPIILNDEIVAEVTLVQLYGSGLESMKQTLLTKYFTSEIYKESYETFSHDTYCNLFLHIKKEFELPEIKEGLFAYESTFTDAKNNVIKYRISYGHPSNEDDYHIFESYVSDYGEYNSYRFFNNDISIQIEKRNIEGFSLGETINERIKHRTK